MPLPPHLTEEQLAVVHHAAGHARVSAVAGSGKTATLVARNGIHLRKNPIHLRKQS
jgi:superfamily I DNA/RNA helicase